MLSMHDVTHQWPTFTAAIRDTHLGSLQMTQSCHIGKPLHTLPKPAPLMGPTKCNWESTVEMETKCHCIHQYQQLHHNSEGLERLHFPPFNLNVTSSNEPPGDQSYLHALLKGYQRSSASFTWKCIIKFWCCQCGSYDDAPLLLQTILLAMESSKDLLGESNAPKLGRCTPKIHSQKHLCQ